MRGTDQRFFWTWVAIAVFVTVGGFYYAFTVQQLQQSIDRLERSTAQLTDDVALINDNLTQRTLELDERLNQSVTALNKDIEDTEQRSLSQIRGIEGKLGEVEQQSKELEDRIVDLNVQSEDFSTTVDQTLQSVVSIFTNLGSGSGAIVDEEGYIITNYHVVEGVRQGAVRMYDGSVHRVRIVATSSASDLALLKIETDTTLRALAFEPADDVRPGTRVIALGSPAGLEFTVTEGIISAVNRENNGVPYVQTDVPINPGNSGGPLVNIQGNIVGINTFKARGFEGIGFAIQSDHVERFVRAAIERDEELQAQQTA